MPAILAEMEYAYPLLSVHLNPDRPHKPLAFISPVSRNFQIHMHAVKTKRTVITAAAAGVFADPLPAFFADEAFVVGDHVFTDVHVSNGWPGCGSGCGSGCGFIYMPPFEPQYEPLFDPQLVNIFSNAAMSVEISAQRDGLFHVVRPLRGRFIVAADNIL